MLKVLRKSGDVAANNVYLLYVLGKEYEDLGRWRAKKAGFVSHALTSVV